MDGVETYQFRYILEKHIQAINYILSVSVCPLMILYAYMMLD